VGRIYSSADKYILKLSQRPYRLEVVAGGWFGFIGGCIVVVEKRSSINTT
jgi:hypothetical protein